MLTVTSHTTCILNLFRVFKVVHVVLMQLKKQHVQRRFGSNDFPKNNDFVVTVKMS